MNKSTREATMQAVCEAATRDKNVVLVSPDAVLAGRALPFLEKFPDRVFEVGIAEQNAVGMAAGLASMGLTPVVVSYAGFLTMRACEQVRTFIAYPGLNVKLIGLNGGLLGGEREGVTHQFHEDVGILRSMPGVAVLTPADAHQAYKAAQAMLAHRGPAYIRLGSGREPEVFTPDVPFEFGKVHEVLKFGNDVAFFASGYIMNRAIEAVTRLNDEGVRATLVNVSTVKPLDEDAVEKLLRECGCAVAAEDHNIYGGMSSAICEVAARRFPVKVVSLGLNDIYPRSGKPDDLLDEYGLSVAEMVNACKIARL